MVPALIVPMISKGSQPTGDEDAGQFIIKVAVPLLLILPMFLTIIFRQVRVMSLWPSIYENEVKAIAYNKQSLWPFDRNWASKIGIILAFLMLSYLLGISMDDLAIVIS
jgi:hypothetical protein